MDFLPGIDGEGVPRVLASFMNALLRGNELPLVDGGQQRRSFIAVADFVEAVCRMIERPDALSQTRSSTSAIPTTTSSIRELAGMLATAFAARVPHAPRPRASRDVTREEFYGEGYDDSDERIPDIGKARRLLDWQPRTDLGRNVAADRR